MRTRACEPPTAPPIVRAVLRAPGRPLDAGVRADMEGKFGHDFGKVRVHTDAPAAASAAAVGAAAYTVGPHVVFGVDRFHPGTARGRRLLAHELAHVVQQSAGPARPAGDLAIGPESDPAERAADRAAAGGGADVGRVGGPVLQRAMVCAKRLEAPGLGLLANHAYIDDTGRDDCRGGGLPGNYAVQQMCSGNGIVGCAVKTDHSTDPQSYTPNSKPCTPKPGVTDLSRCLRDAFDRYTDPGTYSNAAAAAGLVAGGGAGGAAGARFGGVWGGVAGAVGGAAVGGAVGAQFLGPNSNTFAGTLARACCADATDAGLGWVPGWNHAPAEPCECK